MKYLVWLSMFVVTNAVADTGNANSGMMGQIIMLAVLFATMYFLLIRPQSKRAKEHKELIANLNEGDEVITSGGVLGKITRVSEQFFMVTIADGVDVPVQKQAVTLVLPKGTIKSL